MSLSHMILSELELQKVFLSIFSLLIASYSFGYFFNKLQLPKVVGEICGGILLGPSILGNISPEYCFALFKSFPEQGKVIAFLYWMGLALLMLVAGFEFSRSSIKKDKNLIINLIVSSTVIPILGGLIFCHLYDFSSFKGIKGTDLSLTVIICISIAITSIPVISKIFIDLDIIDSRFAKIVLATAALHDLILWGALDIAIKTTSVDKAHVIFSSITTILFLMCSLFFGPRLINKIAHINHDMILKVTPVGYILIICLGTIIITHYLHINIIFGALMAGVMVGTLPKGTFQVARESIRHFSLAFFIPLYFGVVGLKLNIIASFNLKLFLTFLFISSALEIGSVVLGLKLIRKNWLTCFNFGFAMNTRGGPGIVIATMAYDFSIINDELFTALILVAVVTSIISGAWFRYILKNFGTLYKDEDEISSNRIFLSLKNIIS